MKRCVLFLIRFLGLIIMNSCYKSPKNVKITRVTMQRIEVDDSTLAGKILYMFMSTYEVHEWELNFCLSPAPPPTYGSYEPLYDIIVQDAKGDVLNNQIFPLDSCMGQKCSNVHLTLANDTLETIIVSCNKTLYDIKNEYRYRAIDITCPKIFYVEKGQPLPNSIVVKFKDRELNAKVVNTPITFQVKMNKDVRGQVSDTSAL